LNTTEFSHSWTKNIAEVAGLDIESIALNPVAAGDGKVFVTTAEESGPHLAMALDSANGDTVWRYDDFGDIYSVHPPAYANSTVYIQSSGPIESILWAFEAELGGFIFVTDYEDQGARYYAPTIYEGNVYVGGGYDYGVYGYNGVSGEELWFAEWGNPCEQWTPAVNNNHVIAYTGLYNPQLTVIHRSGGETWKAGDVDFSIPDTKFVFNPSDIFSMDLAPVLGSLNDVIVINGGRLISFDLAGKKIGWQIPQDDENVEGDEEEKGGKQFSGQPSLANGFIYAAYKGYLHARNESDGSFEWEWQPPSGESIVTPMIVTDNLIFVSTESTTYAVDLESQTDLWSYPAGGHLALSNDGLLYIATSEGNLIAISTIALEEL
jgi:outer membrane protein assembly factor BamB